MLLVRILGISYEGLITWHFDYHMFAWWVLQDMKVRLIGVFKITQSKATPDDIRRVMR